MVLAVTDVRRATGAVEGGGREGREEEEEEEDSSPLIAELRVMPMVGG